MPLALGSRFLGNLVFYVKFMSISNPEEGQMYVWCRLWRHRVIDDGEGFTIARC